MFKVIPEANPAAFPGSPICQLSLPALRQLLMLFPSLLLPLRSPGSSWQSPQGPMAGQGSWMLLSSPLLSLPSESPENSLLRPCVAPDDRSLCPCPSLFRDSGVGFPSGILLRTEKRKKHHRRQMALTQRRHLAENSVKKPRTHGLNFSQLTQECNKSGP